MLEIPGITGALWGGVWSKVEARAVAFHALPSRVVGRILLRSASPGGRFGRVVHVPSFSFPKPSRKFWTKVANPERDRYGVW